MDQLHTDQEPSPPGGSHDHLYTFNTSELAWEFLRRNHDYQNDFATLATPILAPEPMSSGHRLWLAPDEPPTAPRWHLWPLVDPRLSALDAPLCWLPDTSAAILPATAVQARVTAQADLSLTKPSCLQHIVVRHDGTQCLLVQSTDLSIALHVRGDRILDTPVDLTFQLHRLFFAAKAGLWLSKLPGLLATPQRRVWKTPRRKQLRDALIAFDGHLAGADYRDLALLIFGRAQVETEWSSSNRIMKDNVIRSLRRGRALVQGGYLRLIV